MNKETWRELLNDTSEAIYTPIFYMMYRSGVITKEQYKAMASRNNPLEFDEFMDKLTEVTK